MSEQEKQELIEKDYRERMRICAALGVADPSSHDTCEWEMEALIKLGDHVKEEWSEEDKWASVTHQRLTQYQSPKVIVEKENG